MKILVAVDGSRFTKRMLAYLAAHDEWLGAHHDYTLLTVAPTLPGRATTVLDEGVVRQYYEEESEKVFKPIRSFLERQGIAARYVSRVGSPAELIVRQAASGRFDLVAERLYRWTRRFDSRSLVGLLRTYSDHRALPAARRARTCPGSPMSTSMRSRPCWRRPRR